MTTPRYNLAIVLYQGGDLLDYTGPLEVFNSVYTRPSVDAPAVFHTTTFARTSPIKAAATGTMTVIPDSTLSDLKGRLEEFDVLVIPGAGPKIIKDLIASEEGREIMDLIKHFLTLKPRDAHRVLLSVCTGALILGAAGVLRGKQATTHHMFYDMLSEVSAKAGGEVEVLKGKRWVDAGRNEAGVNIVTTGGVSSGLDGSLYIVQELAGKEASDFAGEIVEFERRQGEEP
ncbi:transcriptional regulator [Gloeophyllum trabeum ATCC 11539]|uniref:Transcriptional regulator n=1 Tax=Gloeophyllum trabeum (strain ATCC 11539 / FP-39264 / Madison 617) TaxID=670483 RepID=S7PRW7_GLOTA|nr:transcriptional regulator [Gloeophyllum trabeum ATCC 11539]EPQ50117.1 transcriptional regulator [Gloeophyllum trabeum ATCC 11539]